MSWEAWLEKMLPNILQAEIHAQSVFARIMQNARSYRERNLRGLELPISRLEGFAVAVGDPPTASMPLPEIKWQPMWVVVDDIDEITEK